MICGQLQVGAVLDACLPDGAVMTHCFQSGSMLLTLTPFKPEKVRWRSSSELRERQSKQGSPTVTLSLISVWGHLSLHAEHPPSMPLGLAAAGLGGSQRVTLVVSSKDCRDERGGSSQAAAGSPKGISFWCGQWRVGSSLWGPLVQDLFFCRSKLHTLPLGNAYVLCN